MIGKVITGKSFGGCIRYVVQKHDAAVLDSAGIRIQEASQMIDDFNLQRKFNPDLGKAVGHIVLSWSVNDAAKLNDELMVTLAKEYLHKMRIRDTQYLVVKHNDREHPHIHLIYNRVDNSGKTIADNFQKQRNVHVAKELTLKHGFYFSPGKEQVKRQALKGADKVKYELFDAIRSASKKVKTIDELIKLLAKSGISTHLKYKGNSNEVQGISFSKCEYKFKGSEIDRSLSYAKLTNTIQEQQIKPEKSLADQLREAMRNNEQVIKPETHHLKQALSAGAELFGGLMANMPEEDDTPEIKRRKRNGQEQSKGISR
ncbi:MAG: relaxase/mobilization nuclease domain-containing protein [Mucilaginibacter sp.]